MSWDIDLAKEFKKRDNKTPIGFTFGEIISINPLRVSVFEGKMILDSPYRCSNYTATLGDTVLCLADSTGQVYTVIDKVVL
jgi:hypothetical protein